MSTIILRHISVGYGVDTNNDGSFDVFLPEGSEGEVGIVAAANGSDYGSGERRCGIVFDLSTIPGDSKILSAMLDLEVNSGQGGGSYEVHGFANCSVTLPSLAWSKKVAGPFPNYVPFPLNVSGFVKSHFELQSYCVGFSVRNVASEGGQAFDGRDVSIRPDRAPSLTIDYREGDGNGGSTIYVTVPPSAVRIVFGVTNDGGGLIQFPNGHIVRVPPSPPDPFFQEIAQGIGEFARGLGVRQIILEGTAPSTAIKRESLHLVAKSLEDMLQAVRKELGRIEEEA